MGRKCDVCHILKFLENSYINKLIEQRTGLPAFLLCWQFSSYITHPELVIAYFIMRYSCNYWPGSNINEKLVEGYKLRYPKLSQCNWSRKVPDPTKQSVDAFANRITTNIPLLAKVDSFLDNNKIGKSLKNFRARVYSLPIKHGFAWDIADNTRIVIGLPLLFAMFHYGGMGLYITDSEYYNPVFFQWMCTYIGGAYMARLSSNWGLRIMALTTTEKQYGLRSDTGVYYGYKKDEDINQFNKKKTRMNNAEYDAETVSTGKVSSRKPKRK